MTVLQAVFLGLLQGVTEFLPVSSSGHLEIAAYFFGVNDAPLVFSVLLHCATLCAVLIFFRKRIIELFFVLWHFVIKKQSNSDKNDLQTIFALLIGTITTVVIALLLRKTIPHVSLKVVSAGFLFTAFLLIFSSFFRKNTKNQNHVTLLQGFFTGLAQGIGVIPGISRSGITISTSLFTGVSRKTAGEFSFLLSIPAILGALLLEINDLPAFTLQIPPFEVIAGCLTAFAAAFFSLIFLLKLVQNGKLFWFAFYLVPAGILGLVFLP